MGASLNLIIDSGMLRDEPASTIVHPLPELETSESSAPEEESVEGWGMNDLRCWFRTATIRCLCSIIEETKDSDVGLPMHACSCVSFAGSTRDSEYRARHGEQVLARVAESLKANPMINQICSNGDIFNLTTKAEPHHLHLLKSHRVFSEKRWQDRGTWVYNVEHRLNFSPGFEKFVEEEMVRRCHTVRSRSPFPIRQWSCCASVPWLTLRRMGRVLVDDRFGTTSFCSISKTSTLGPGTARCTRCEPRTGWPAVAFAPFVEHSRASFAHSAVPEPMAPSGALRSECSLRCGPWQALRDLKHEHPRLAQHLHEHTSHVELARTVDGKVRVERMYFPLDEAVVRLSKSRDLKVRLIPPCVAATSAAGKCSDRLWLMAVGQAEMDLRIRSLPQIMSAQKYHGAFFASSVRTMAGTYVPSSADGKGCRMGQICSRC